MIHSLLPFLDTAGGSNQFVTVWREEEEGEKVLSAYPSLPPLRADLGVEAHCTCPEDHSQKEEEERSKATQEEQERWPSWPLSVQDLSGHVEDEV